MSVHSRGQQRLLRNLAHRLTVTYLQPARGLSSDSHALLQATELDATKLNGTQLESLAFVLSIREQSAQDYASKSPQEAAQYFNTLLHSRVQPAGRLAILQKMVAATGIESTPALLAWSSNVISEQLRSAIGSMPGWAGTPHMRELLGLAHAWQAAKTQADGSGKIAMTAEQLMAVFLSTPGALGWDQLLGLHSLEGLLAMALTAPPPAQAQHSHTLLEPILTLLNVQHGASSKPSQLATISEQLAVLQASTEQRLASRLPGAQQGSSVPADLVQQASQVTGPAGGEPLTDAITLRLAAFITSSLGITGPSSAMLVMRLLGCSRPGTDSGNSSNIQGSLDVQLVVAAAQELAAAHAANTGAGHVLRAKHEAVLSSLKAAAGRKPDGAAAQLLQQIQALRTQLLLAGDIPTLLSTSSEDLAALEPQQFWQLYSHVRKLDATGAAAAQTLGLLGPQPAPLSAPQLQALRSLPEHFRAALAWTVLRRSQPQGPATASGSSSLAAQPAVDALYAGFVEAAYLSQREASAAQVAPEELSQVMAAEAALAEVDLMNDRTPPPLQLLPLAGQPGGPVPLPFAAELAAARSSLPESQMALFDQLSKDTQHGLSSSANSLGRRKQLAAAFHALLSSTSDLSHAAELLDGSKDTRGGTAESAGSSGGESDLPASLADWQAEATTRLVGLSPATLSMLSSFLSLRLQQHGQQQQQAAPGLSSGKAIAVEAVAKLRLLGREVAAALQQAERLQGGGVASTSGRQGARAQPVSGSKRSSRARSLQRSPFWQSPDMPATAGVTGGSSEQSDGFLVRLDDEEGGVLPGPEAVRVLLGEGEGAEYEAWLQASGLLGGQENASSSSSKQSQPYEILAEQHRNQDIQRYLTMEHDPALHLSFTSAPRHWADPALTAVDEPGFLQQMRPLLNSYLEARGMRPLLDSEWGVYSAAALTEFAQHRTQHEAALQEAGHSAWFNSRAEALYLRQLLATGLPPGSSPLADSAPRYLAVLEANSSWTFAQRKHAVQRLIELGMHFAKLPQAGPSESLFAPLFEPEGKAAPLAPVLQPRRSIPAAVGM